MPRAPRPGCSYPGCSKRAAEGSSYCEEHRMAVNKDYEEHGRHYKAHKRYGRNWKRIRDRYIRMHPLCEECMKNNKATPATQVHHIKTIAAGGTNEFSNLESVCDACHNRIHNRLKEEYHY